MCVCVCVSAYLRVEALVSACDPRKHSSEPPRPPLSAIDFRMQKIFASENLNLEHAHCRCLRIFVLIFQYLCFCTSRASKLSTCGIVHCRRSGRHSAARKRIKRAFFRGGHALGGGHLFVDAEQDKSWILQRGLSIADAGVVAWVKWTAGGVDCVVLWKLAKWECCGCAVDCGCSVVLRRLAKWKCF